MNRWYATMRRHEPNETAERVDRADDPRADGGTARRHRWMTTDEIAAAYDDAADRAARWRRLDRLFAGRYRRRQFGRAEGRVLDVACGTGTNFRYLPASVELTGIDASAEMLAHAEEERERLGLDGGVRKMDAQDLAFPDDAFDTVVSSFSTCTFPDPHAALREMGRVCRPDGRILLLEHGRSTVGPVARWQDWRADAQYEKVGCRANHEPLRTVRGSDLSVEDSRTALFGLVVAVDALPPGHC